MTTGARISAGIKASPVYRAGIDRRSSSTKWRANIAAHHAGRRWITDGTETRRVKADEPIPEGWTFGRAGVRSHPQSRETREKISVARTGMKFSLAHCANIRRAKRRAL